jgi:hypothetical protein
MPHPGLTQYMKINTKYFDRGVTEVVKKKKTKSVIHLRGVYEQIIT